MNVLLISQSYPPYPIVGALRAQKIAEMFHGRGHRVFVITQRLDDEGPSLRIDEPGLQVRTVPVGAPYKDRVLGAFKWRRLPRSSGSGRVDGGAQPAPDVEPSAGSVKRGVLRRTLLPLLRFPDDEMRFVRPALNAAREVLQEHPIDIVYTSTPPRSSNLVGLRLRATADVLWMAEFRDPWTQPPAPGRMSHQSDLVRAMHRFLELRCLRAADRIIAVTEGARKAIADKLPERERDKVVVALNGIGVLHERERRDRVGPFRIVHAGTFYMDRDPRPFLRALSQLCEERNLGPDDIVVDLVGRCRSFGDVSVEMEAEALGLTGIVRFHDWVTHDEAQEMLHDSDLLLLLATSQPLQIPNKLFDYLGSRTPILAVVDAGGESDRMLRAVGGQYVVSVSPGEQVSHDAVRDALADALDASDETVQPLNEKLLLEWSVEHQMLTLAEALGA